MAKSILDKNFWRTEPTWHLICELMGHHRHVPTIKLVLNERMDACGALSLIELVAAEAAHAGAPLPVTLNWDRAAELEAGELLALHPPHWK